MVSNNSAIATVVERYSRFTVLCKLDSKRATSVLQPLTEQMKRLPKQVLTSLTWDRGHEMSAHKTFTMATNMAVYFCDHSSPWQRGSNENTNGLLRQYFPKGKGMGIYSQSQLDEMYGTEVSPTLISSVTDAVIEEVKAWQGRPLDSVYPIVYLDCIHVKIRDSGVVKAKAIYLALGITMTGQKEVLGLWVAQTEGAKFWL